MPIPSKLVSAKTSKEMKGGPVEVVSLALKIDRTQCNRRDRISWEREKKESNSLAGFAATLFVCGCESNLLSLLGSTAPDMAPVGGGENRRSRLRCLLEESALPRTQQSN